MTTGTHLGKRSGEMLNFVSSFCAAYNRFSDLRSFFILTFTNSEHSVCTFEL
jgi:hypothetical protein